MKKTLLSFFMFVAFIATAWAGDVTFDFTNPTALNPSVTPSETASSGTVIDVNTPFTNGEVTISFVNIDGAKESQMAKIWTQSETKNLAKELRAYKGGSITIAAATNITSIIFDGAKKTTMTATVGTFDNGSWSGSSQTVTFDLSGTININTITVTYSDDPEGGDVVDPTPTPDPDPTPEPDPDPTPEPEPEVERATIFTAPFSANQGEFIFDDVVLPEGSTYVWKHDSSRGYMKASSYVGGASKASESWLTSPVIDLTGSTDCILTFEHCANYFNATENFLAACSVKAKAEGDADWTTLTLDATATGTDWNWVNSTASLADFSDKKIQIAFVYTSTTEVAGTWEVKNVEVAGVGGNVIEVPTYLSIMDLKDNSTADATAIKFAFTELLVTGVSGKYAFVTDGQEGMLFYGTHTLVAGDKIKGTLAGDLTLYNGMTQVSNPDFTDVTVVSQGNEVTPITLTIDQITQNSGYLVYESMLINLDNVYFTAEALASRAVMMKDESENEIKLYDNFNKLTDFTFDTTKPYNVTAVVAQYKGTPQVYVLSADDVKVITNLKEAATTWASEQIAILKGGEWAIENALITDSDAPVAYSSSNEAVATVDAEGNVTVVGFGYAEIIAETAETANYLASKATFKLYVIEGEGTLESPYSVADVQYFATSAEKVWVKGTIIGFYNNNAFHAGVESAPASNLAIGTEALSMPIQLSSGTDVRAALNLLDNPDKLNTEIWLYGKIEKYFSVPGLKSVSDCSFDGKVTLTAIDEVKTDTAKEQVIYSISGQRLSKPMKGINIINGKKVIVK